jgi:hypothetical protein
MEGESSDGIFTVGVEVFMTRVVQDFAFITAARRWRLLGTLTVQVLFITFDYYGTINSRSQLRAKLF